jgi:serine/threonine protein phosphatase PrpC
MRVRSGYASNVGLVRQTNEDSFLVRDRLYVVCDGMGGARAGEVASEMACRGLLAVEPATYGSAELLEAVKDANRAIATRSLEENRLMGMGTTLTGALVGEDSLTLVHVGDSRAYLLHEGRLTQITNDHSWVGEMMRRGELTPNEAAVHPHRSVITKALGTDPEVDPDLFEVPFSVGDRLLLCSDGLTGMVSDQELQQILLRPEPPEDIASLLVQAALAGGGEDNVTVVVVEAVVGSDTEPGDGSAEGQTEPVVGPADRGTAATRKSKVIPLKGIHPSAAMRERLGKKVGPILRPVAKGDAEVRDGSAETPARQWTRRKWVVLAVAVVLVIVVAIAAFAVVNSTVYYVGTANGGVALFHGLPASILGIDLSGVIEQGSVAYDSLAPYVKSRVDAHDLVSKEEGQRFLRSLSATP